MRPTTPAPESPRRRPGWEILAVAGILVLYALANAAIVRARPSMMRAAVARVDSVLAEDRDVLDRDLQQWRQGILGDGRWLADLVGVVLDTRSAKSDARFSPSEVARLQALTLAQMPTARAWVVDRSGTVRATVGRDAPASRHVWLARKSLDGDTTLLAASELRGQDLRLAVASPVHTAAGRGLAVVLDLSARTVLDRRMPKLAWEGHFGRAALTFRLDTGFVGATWTGRADDPQIARPARGWSLTDSSLIVVWGALPDTTPRFELGIPRAAARSLVETRAAWLHATAALAALALCLGVLLAGRASRNARLRAAEKSLAESRLRTAQAEIAATRAGLAAVQARLNPHFLSNALHSVAALIASDPEGAEEALDRLGDLFRYSLQQSERHTVALEEEWRFVRDYLAIEQMRLGDRLTVEMELDPAAAECEVPAFVLQPLVENAIRHGIGPLREGGTVRVSARREGERLTLVVADDGRGADKAAVDVSTGTGLRTLRQRFELDTSLEGHVEIETTPGLGFRARVTLAADPRAEQPLSALGSRQRQVPAPRIYADERG